jgi:signal transduction histidine kinase
MSDVTAGTLYRVAQESLRNVERHAGARAARVELRPAGDDVLLEVTDDGRGFDLADAERRRPGMGLFSMRERVALVGGTLEIDAAPGRGTRVVARAPLAFAGPAGGHAGPRPFMPPTPMSGLR